MKILITGGGGFIGRNLLEKLGQQYEVVAPASSGLNLLQDDEVKDYFARHTFEAVIHAATWDATEFSAKDKALVLENNLRMFFNVARCHDRFGRLISFGSGAEFSRPHYQPLLKEESFGAHVPDDQYGFSKYIINQQIIHLPSAVNLRLFGVFGRYEDYRIRFISNAICRALHDQPITIRQDVAFDYLYINDLPAIVEKFLQCKLPDRDYNICTGHTYRLTDLAKMILATLNKDLPITVAQSGLGLEYSGSNERLLDAVGEINFTPMTQAIKELSQWYQTNLPCLNS